MAHNHTISDSGAYFQVDPLTRTMRIASASIPKLIRNDHNSERFTFSIPRYIDGHDMLSCNRAEIHYLNIGTETGEQSEGFYLADDLHEDPKNKSHVLCTWLIARNATKYVGTLDFLLRLCCVSEEDADYVWNTAIYTGVTVSEGFEYAESEIEKYPDILLQWESRLNTLESRIAELEYEPIEIKNFINSIGTAEIGSYITAVTLSWVCNKTPLKLTIDGKSYLSMVESVSMTGLNITEDTTFTLEVTDERETVATKTTSIKFLNGVYYGVAPFPETLDSAFILGLTRNLRSNKLPSFTVTAGAGEYIWYCVPTRFGDCTFSVGGFTGGFMLEGTVSFTNASGYTEDYYVYRSDSQSLGKTTIAIA
ncbi:MAG: hypothetical protein IJ489_11650 [Clostridia bacterium]|nr:hypothetical protein [Clostridia bacterium]